MKLCVVGITWLIQMRPITVGVIGVQIIHTFIQGTYFYKYHLKNFFQIEINSIS